MILVITGMDPFQFDRVVRPIDALAGRQILNEEVFIQLGACTYVPKHCRYERFLDFAAICENIEAANVIVTHAGAGSTLNCIHHGKYPIVIPRLARYQEAVDDHQVPFAERLHRDGAVTMLLDLDGLLPAIEAARQKRSSPRTSRAPGITAALEDYWRQLMR